MINKERILSLFSSVDKATLHQTTSGESCSIFSIVWGRQFVSLTAIVVEERNLDIYGKIRTGNSTLVPFLFQGQYFDEETDLCYNHFRYYSPDEGMYISQDLIGLIGGITLYGYIHDSNSWIDPLGLAPWEKGGFNNWFNNASVQDIIDNKKVVKAALRALGGKYECFLFL